MQSKGLSSLPEPPSKFLQIQLPAELLLETSSLSDGSEPLLQDWAGKALHLLFDQTQRFLLNTC